MLKDRTINLNTIEWDIKFVPEKSDVLDGNRGMCCYRTSSIYLMDTLKPSELMFGLFHELAHAALSETDYNQEIREHLGDNYEKFVSLLGIRIMEICKQFHNLNDLDQKDYCEEFYKELEK